MTTCHLCRGELLEIPDLESLARVTSDCKPWPPGGQVGRCQACATVARPITDRWLEEIGQIYAAYEIYQLSGGAEQAVFEPGSGQPCPRSERLLGLLSLPPKGRWLDLGCGNGGFLRAMGQAYPDWRLVGLELNATNRSLVESLPGVEELVVGELADVPGRFDGISMIHMLEHVVAPGELLSQAREKLSPEGVLLIEVPDHRQNPFDLVIADHATHFTASTLARLVGQAGFRPERAADDWVPKELSLVARPAPPEEEPCPREPAWAEQHLSWLRQLRDQVLETSRREGGVGLLGTTIAATWLAAELGEAITFFVDEDPQRSGRGFMGRPVYALAQVPEQAPVYLPWLPALARGLQQRLLRQGLSWRPLLPPGATQR